MATEFHWKDRERGADLTVYINRHNLSGPSTDTKHCHDFAELLYAREGEARHSVNSQERRFSAGELICIRPEYIHQMVLSEGSRFSYDVIAFRPDSLLKIQAEHSAEFGAFWNSKNDYPATVILTTVQQHWFEQAIRALAANSNSPFMLNRFLLNLAYEVSRYPSGTFDKAPLWLVQALHEIKDIQNCCRGPRVLAEVSGRSFEHVSRTLKHCCGCTPSQAVNRARMEYAAGQLVLTGQGILEIALDCGFQSLGHFYKEFRRHYNVTPRQYRIQNHKMTDSIDVTD